MSQCSIARGTLLSLQSIPSQDRCPARCRSSLEALRQYSCTCVREGTEGEHRGHLVQYNERRLMEEGFDGIGTHVIMTSLAKKYLLIDTTSHSSQSTHSWADAPARRASTAARRRVPATSVLWRVPSQPMQQDGPRSYRNFRSVQLILSKFFYRLPYLPSHTPQGTRPLPLQPEPPLAQVG
jgi:hypothetical protein